MSGLLRSHWRCLIPFVAAFSIDWTAYGWSRLYAPLFPAAPAFSRAESPALEAYSLQFNAFTSWSVAAFGTSLLAGLTIAACLYMMWTFLPIHSYRARIGSILAVAGLLLVYLWAFAEFFGDVGPEVAGRILDTLEESGLRGAETLTTVMNAAVFSAGWFVAVTLGVLLLPGSGATSLRTRELAHRMRCSRWLLYLSAVFLAVGAYSVYSLYRVPIAWVPHELHAAVETIAMTASSLFGAIFSLMLIVLFGPVFLILSRDARCIAGRTLPGGSHPGQVEEFLTREDLQQANWTMVINLVAAVAPYAVGGALPELLGALL